MADTLHFRNQQIGSQVITHWPTDAPQTPPVDQPGLYQAAGSLNSDSVNMLYGLSVTLFVSNTSRFTAAADVAAIRQLAGLRGIVLLKEAGTTKVMTDDTWILREVAGGELAAGYGGRLTMDLTLLFAGGTPPAYV